MRRQVLHCQHGVHVRKGTLPVLDIQLDMRKVARTAKAPRTSGLLSIYTIHFYPRRNGLCRKEVPLAGEDRCRLAGDASSIPSRWCDAGLFDAFKPMYSRVWIFPEREIAVQPGSIRDERNQWTSRTFLSTISNSPHAPGIPGDARSRRGCPVPIRGIACCRHEDDAAFLLFIKVSLKER